MEEIKYRRETCVSETCAYKGVCDVTTDEYCPSYLEKEG